MTRHATVEELSLRLDAELSDRRRQELDRHLEQCTECRGRLEGLRAVSRALREARQPVPPIGMERRVRKSLRNVEVPSGWLSHLEGQLRRLVLQPSILPVYAIVLALGVILYLFSHGVAQRDIAPVVTRPSKEKEEALRRAEPGAELDVGAGPHEVPESPVVAAQPPAKSADEVATQPRPEAGAAESRLRSAPSLREIGGRSFELHGAVWMEVGTDVAENVTRVGLVEARELLAGEVELLEWVTRGDRVRVRVGGADESVIEIVPTEGD